MERLDFLLVVAVTGCLVGVSYQGPNQRRLLSDLLSSYNPLERPVMNESETLTVEFSLSLMQIMDVDEKNQVLTTNIWLQMISIPLGLMTLTSNVCVQSSMKRRITYMLHQNWVDPYLRWNESDYQGVTDVRFPDHLIWKPDILLYNSADERFDATYRTNIVVKPSGACSYVPPGIFKSTCSIDVRWFPFDIQRCELKFGSWTYDGWALDLKMLEANIHGYTSNGEWDLVEVPGKRHTRIYECCSEPYPDVTFTVVMRRRTLYYGLNLLIPCVLISILAMLVFLLPADSGEKISLGITVLLSLTVFMLLVAEIMPATSDSVPLIAQYFATTMVIVGLSVIATVLVLQYHHHDPNGSKMPKWTRVVLLNWCAWFLRMKRPGEDQVRSACHSRCPRTSLSSTELTANISGPHSTNGNMLGVHGLESLHYSAGVTSPDSAIASGCLAGRAGEEELLLSSPQGSSGGVVELGVAKILEELRYISKRFHIQDRDESVCNEWKFAASVIDRLCLVAFSVFTILCTIGILMSAPNFVEAISKDFFT